MASKKEDPTKKESKSLLLKNLDNDVAQLFKNGTAQSSRIDQLDAWIKTEYIPSNEGVQGEI